MPNSKRFLFVNQSESSTQPSKATVQRYVQTGRKRPRNSRRNDLSTNRSDASNWSQVATGNESASKDSQCFSSIANEADDSRRSLMLREHAVTPRSDQDPIIPNVQLAITPLAFRSSLNKRDPFDAASLPLNRFVARLLDYYMYYYHPCLWPNERILLRHGIYAFPDSVQNIMETAVTNKLAMCSLLSASLCRLKYIDQLPYSSVAGIESLYIREALRLMSSYIATSNFQTYAEIRQCLICMVYLSSAESYRGDLFAAKAHLAPAARILQPLGGLEFVKDDNLKGQLAMADLALACKLLEPCLFDCSYNPGPASTLHLKPNEVCQAYETSTASFLLDRFESFIPSELKVLIKELVESHSVKSRIWTDSMQHARAVEVTHWISLRNMAIRNRLLALRITDFRTHALRIAIIMWSLLFNISGRVQTVKMMAPILQSVLVNIQASSWTESEEIRLWIVLLGFYCAKEGTNESLWFVNECNSLICSDILPGNQDMIERLESFQLKFFYDIPAQNAQTRNLVQILLLSSS